MLKEMFNLIMLFMLMMMLMEQVLTLCTATACRMLQESVSRTILFTECLDAEPFTWRPQCFHRFAFRRSAFIALLSTIAGLFCTACGVFAATFVCFASVFRRASMSFLLSTMLFLKASRSFLLSSKLCLSSLEEARKAFLHSFAIRSRSFAIRVLRSAVRFLRLSARISSAADRYRPHTGSEALAVILYMFNQEVPFPRSANSVCRFRCASVGAIHDEYNDVLFSFPMLFTICCL